MHQVAEGGRSDHLDAGRLPVGLHAIVSPLLLRKEEGEQLELVLTRARLRQHLEREVAAARHEVVLLHKDALHRRDLGMEHGERTDTFPAS